VWLITSASASAARSAGVKRDPSSDIPTAAILAADAPASLLPAALMSLQKGQPTSRATWRQTSDRSSAGSLPLFAGAALSARLASRIGGQYAWIPLGARGWP